MNNNSMTIALAADHRGFAVKEQIKQWLTDQAIDTKDFGAQTILADDDYPDYAKPASDFVAAEPANRRGIFICGTGQGMMIVANKSAGIRAILIDRADGFYAGEAPNVLAVAADQLTFEETKRILGQWFASFDEPLADRHLRRIGKIQKLEAGSLSFESGSFRPQIPSL